MGYAVSAASRLLYNSLPMRIFLFLTLAVALLCAPSVNGQAANPAIDLDGIAKQVIARERVAGASILVARGDRILLHKGYGFADLGLEAPTRDETVYHVVGPMLPFTGIAVLQQMERGKLSLDDDISKFIPEFPLQGHHVTIRQL